MLAMLLSAAFAAGQSGPIPASPPGHFYNRPGATLAMRDRDLTRCRAITTGPMVETNRPLTPPVGPDLPRPAVSTTGTIEDCMAERGWNLYALSRRERARWGRLSPSAQARLRGEWTGMRRPSWGRLVRPGAPMRRLHIPTP